MEARWRSSLAVIALRAELKRRPRPAPIGVREAAEVRRGPFSLFLVGPFLASGVVRMGPDRP